MRVDHEIIVIGCRNAVHKLNGEERLGRSPCIFHSCSVNTSASRDFRNKLNATDTITRLYQETVVDVCKLSDKVVTGHEMKRPDDCPLNGVELLVRTEDS